MRKGTVLAVALAAAIGWFSVGLCIGSSIEWNIQQSEVSHANN